MRWRSPRTRGHRDRLRSDGSALPAPNSLHARVLTILAMGPATAFPWYPPPVAIPATNIIYLRRGWLRSSRVKFRPHGEHEPGRRHG
jgi:hypothetical protein